MFPKFFAKIRFKAPRVPMWTACDTTIYLVFQSGHVPVPADQPVIATRREFRHGVPFRFCVYDRYFGWIPEADLTVKPIVTVT